MENINLNIEKTLDFISKEKLASYEPKVKACMETLEKGTGLGNDFLGWLHLPSSITKEHLDDLKATAQTLRKLRRSNRSWYRRKLPRRTRSHRSYVKQLCLVAGEKSRTAYYYFCRTQHQRRLPVRTD